MRQLGGKKSNGKVGTGCVCTFFIFFAALMGFVLVPLVAMADDKQLLNEQLISAAESGDLAAAKSALEKGADVNAKEKCGWTPLILAAKHGKEDIVKLLLSRNAMIDEKDSRDRTALMWAAVERYADVVKLLLEHKADVNAKTPDGETALTYATRFFEYDHLISANKEEEFSERNCDFSWTRKFPTHSFTEHPDVVRLLIEHGAEMTLSTAVTLHDKTGIQELVATGVNIDSKATNGVTALMSAVEWDQQWGNPVIVRWLLDKGSNINLQDNYGWTALTRAVILGRPDISKLLLDKGADVNTVDKFGWTLLMMAIRGHNTDAVEQLLSKGVDVNARTKKGRTALMEASRQGEAEVVSRLLASGADVNVKTIDGETALMLAVQSDPGEPSLAAIVKLLLDRGVDINAKNASGKTAIDLARINKLDELVRLLESPRGSK